jgi:hypothetical protein
MELTQHQLRWLSFPQYSTRQTLNGATQVARCHSPRFFCEPPRSSFLSPSDSSSAAAAAAATANGGRRRAQIRCRMPRRARAASQPRHGAPPAPAPIRALRATGAAPRRAPGPRRRRQGGDRAGGGPHREKSVHLLHSYASSVRAWFLLTCGVCVAAGFPPFPSVMDINQIREILPHR